MSKTILLTGATSGIGKAAALEFIKQNCNLIIPARDIQKAESLISEATSKGKGSIRVYNCDLASQQSIKDFVKEVKNDYKSIDVLINNAGIWNPKPKKTPDSIEQTFAVNVLAPYFITSELFSLVEAGNDKKIIFTSSALNRGILHFDDLQFEKKYNGFLVYQQSKLADILLVKYFAEKLAEKNITVNCFHPGMVNTSLGDAHTKFSRTFFKLFGTAPENGAETLVYLALSSESAKISGEYFANKKVTKTSPYSCEIQNAYKLVEELEKLRK